MTSTLLKHESNLGVAFQRWNQSRAQKGFNTDTAWAGLSFSNIDEFKMYKCYLISLQGRTHCRLVVKMELRLSCMSCCAQIILHWCLFSVLYLATRLSFESREEGAGEVPLQNSESVSAVHILSPLCQCYIHIHLNSFFHIYKYTPLMQTGYQNNNCHIFFSLCRRLWCLWRTQLAAR